MVEYTEDQVQQLRNRWKGHEEELKAVISLDWEDPEWNKSEEYKALMEALGSLPEGVEKVNWDLRGVSLGAMDLSGKELVGVDLSWASLLGTDLSGADLVFANLTGARLVGIDLSGAGLEQANLSRADLRGANLSDTDLRGADLSGADLREANLSGSYLGYGDILSEEPVGEGVDLSGADLQKADLSNTRSLMNARWNPRHRFWPRIGRFDFWGKKLKPFERKTVFSENDIRNANWSGAVLLKRYVEDENFLEEYVRRPGWRHKTVSWLWKWTCDYGRSFGRWASMSLVLALFFGGLYAAHPTWFQQEMGPLSPWYFSVVTFTTLGFGDLTPKPECWQAQAWIMAEVILGYIMLGGLISIFANKLARRA